MDEFCFVSRSLFNVFQPQSLIDGSCMIMLSSPTQGRNWAIEMFENKKNDESNDSAVWNASFEMICDECAAKENASEMLKCNHQTTRGSKLKSRKRKRELMELKINDVETARENLGVIIQDTVSAFKKYEIDNLFDERNFSSVDISMAISQKKIRYFVFAVDPHVGGECQTGITAGTVIDGTYVILYQNLGDDKRVNGFNSFIMNSLIEFQKKFRTSYTVPTFVIVEGNTCWAPDTINSLILSSVSIENSNQIDFQTIKNLDQSASYLYNCIVLSDEQHKYGKCGVRTDHDRLDQGTVMISTLMSTGSIKLHKDYHTDHVNGKDYMFKCFRDQSSRFRHYQEGTNSKISESGSRKKILRNNSGKTGAHSDDLMLSTILFVLWFREILTNPAYRLQRKNVGLNF